MERLVKFRTLGLLVLLAATSLSFAANPSLDQPVATLDWSRLLPEGGEEPFGATATFLSEASIAVGGCRRVHCSAQCSLSIVTLENGSLKVDSSSFAFEAGSLIHRARDGRVLVNHRLDETTLYSVDLSTSQKLPSRLWLISPSGESAAEWGRTSSKIFRLADRPELLRNVVGNLQAMSDDVLVVHDDKNVRVEDIAGQSLGTFVLPSRDWGHTALLGSSRLYFDDCRKARILDFAGKTLLEMHLRNVCGQVAGTSADGTRMLLDSNYRKVPPLQHILETAHTISTLGMIGPEDVNGEEVEVIDTLTGKTCFDWRQKFPLTNAHIRSAAISPSGKLVAIAGRRNLEIYEVPPICGGR
jgi:hypothetical protein